MVILSKKKTPGLRETQRGNRILNKIGFQGWKLQCQVVVSKICNIPTKAPASIRTKCPGCLKNHKDFTPCLRQAGIIKNNKINDRLSRLILMAKRANIKINEVYIRSEITAIQEWININELFGRNNARGEPKADT